MQKRPYSREKMNEENKPLIKRTGSLIEITIGDRKAQGLRTDSREEDSCLGFCFKSLSKLQFCILAIIAIVTLILALFFIIILVGTIASHGQRLRDLEIKAEILEASNAHLLIPMKNLTNNETEFVKEMRETIKGAIQKFDTILFETVFSRKDQLENRVDQLVNRTDSIDTQLDLLSNQIQEQQLVKNMVETPSNSTQLTIEEAEGDKCDQGNQGDQGDQGDKCDQGNQGDQGDQDDEDIQDHSDSSDQDPEDKCDCDKVIFCMKFTKHSNFLCTRLISSKEFQNVEYKYLNELGLDYQWHCDNS